MTERWNEGHKTGRMPRKNIRKKIKEGRGEGTKIERKMKGGREEGR